MKEKYKGLLSTGDYKKISNYFLQKKNIKIGDISVEDDLGVIKIRIRYGFTLAVYDREGIKFWNGGSYLNSKLHLQNIMEAMGASFITKYGQGVFEEVHIRKKHILV